MDALLRIAREPPAARARRRSRRHAATTTMPGQEPCGNPPGPGPESACLERFSKRNYAVDRGVWKALEIREPWQRCGQMPVFVSRSGQDERVMPEKV